MRRYEVANMASALHQDARCRVPGADLGILARSLFPREMVSALTAIPNTDLAAPAAQSRNAGLDALRATLTVLVLFHHSAITYGAIGGWFYREVPTDGRLETRLLILFCIAFAISTSHRSPTG
jgi:hypothetical protein